MLRRTALKFLLLGGTAACVGIMEREQNPVQSRIAFAHDLPAMPGQRLKAALIEVMYPPGAASAPHTHACPVIGYVLHGAIRFQVDSQPEVVFHAGESFYETAEGHSQSFGECQQYGQCEISRIFRM